MCACRGVVRLFNAVAKAQKQRKEALEGPKKKAAAVSKAAFLAELQGQATKPPQARPATHCDPAVWLWSMCSKQSSD